jgi:ribosomal protein S18 acetylase RimI-like enzyme
MHIENTRQTSYRQIKQLIFELEERVAKFGASDFDVEDDPRVRRLRFIRLTSDIEDQLIMNSYNFMISHFGDEAETYNWFVHSIKYCAYDYLVVCNEENRVVALSRSQYLKIRENRTQGDNQSILAIWYIAVDRKYRNRGLAKALYSEMYKRTLKLARSRRHEILAIVGEAVESVEEFLNAMGRKRLYQRVRGTLEEVSYEYPPMDFDPKTGEVSGATGIEHLMVRFLDDRQGASTSDIIRIVETIYYEYLGRKRNYVSYKAYSNAEKYITQMKRNFIDHLSAGG